MLLREGVHALYLDGQSIRTETVAAARGNRPWVREAPVVRRPLDPGSAFARGSRVPREPRQDWLDVE